MTLIDDIARVEAAAKSHFTKAKALEARSAGLEQEYSQLVKAKLEEADDKIVLDPKLDPDPFGYHGMSLHHRLKCMGWP